MLQSEQLVYLQKWLFRKWMPTTRPEACVSVSAQVWVCVVHVGRENWFVLGTHHSFELQEKNESFL